MEFIYFGKSRRLLLTCLLMCMGLSSTAHAEEKLQSSSAHALDFTVPRGRWAARVEVRVNGYDKWYDENGNLVDLDKKYDGLDLGSNIFPSLAVFGPGMSLGNMSIDSKIENIIAELLVGYGLTDDLTIGLQLPFGRSRTAVDFLVSGGNIGFNPAFNPAVPIGAANFPFAPVGAGATEPVGTEGLRKILTDPAFGYGYKRIEDTTVSGLSDPTVGILWRFHKSKNDSAILGLGVRFGLAREDDPDNLLDVPLGDGSTDLRARLEYFRNMGAGFDARFLVEHIIQMEDHVTVRVPAPGELLATSASKENVTRDLGDYFEYDIELGKSLANWRLSGTWHRYDKGSDRYRSGQGTDTSSLEKNTSVRADQWRASISWSGIESWQRGDLPMPLIVKLEVQDTYSGMNFPNVRDYYLRFTSFF